MRRRRKQILLFSRLRARTLRDLKNDKTRRRQSLLLVLYLILVIRYQQVHHHAVGPHPRLLAVAFQEAVVGPVGDLLHGGILKLPPVGIVVVQVRPHRLRQRPVHLLPQVIIGGVLPDGIIVGEMINDSEVRVTPPTRDARVMVLKFDETGSYK